uniref:Uncharacterized protein n=1 Tax=Calidris pygmaea TaxID=425635 RepID=A0A8C3JWD7_9CHAR
MARRDDMKSLFAFFEIYVLCFSLCRCVYAYTYTHINLHTHTYTHAGVYVLLSYTPACTYTHVCIYASVCTCLHINGEGGAGKEQRKEKPKHS